MQSPLASAALGTTPPASTDTLVDHPIPVVVAPQRGLPKSTMLGMPAVAIPAAAPAAVTSNHSAEQATEPSPPAASLQGMPANASLPSANRTMLGVTPPTAPVAPSGGAVPAQPHRTMLGVQPATPAVRSQALETNVDTSDAYPVVPVKKALWPWFLLAAVALSAIGFAAYSYLSQTSRVRASVQVGEAGEELALDLPGAANGVKVIFGGVERVVASGRVVFPLASESLRVGSNDISVDVIDTSGEVRTETVVLDVEYRVVADLGGLDADPPVLRLVVDSIPGVRAEVASQAVVLDGNGHGVAVVPVVPGESALLESSTPYRIFFEDGRTAAGEVKVRIPYASLVVDRPGRRVVTDDAEIEVLGGVGPRGQVLLDGEALSSSGGRFRTMLRNLPVGSSEHVLIAREPGHAPRRMVLAVNRVADLRAAARAYPVEAIPYARLLQNAESYRGRHVRFAGRVYNVDVREGRSVLQMLVADCPNGQRCALWVTYEGATGASVEDNVEVVGALAGEQQFRTPSGEVRTVPRLDAVFVVEEE